MEPDATLNDGGSASGGVVQLASGTILPYDWLVVALGASADPRGVPGIKDNARPFSTLADAEFVAGRLAAFEARAALAGEQQQQATVVIVGAGYAGVELAAVVGERMKGKASVVVVTPGSSILESAPAGQRQAAEEVRGNTDGDQGSQTGQRQRHYTDRVGCKDPYPVVTAPLRVVQQGCPACIAGRRCLLMFAYVMLRHVTVITAQL